MMRTGGPGSPEVALAARVRAARGPKAPVDPLRPAGVWDEAEVAAPGETVPTRVVLLTGAECPFTCTTCDLWRHTLDGPTPPGALPVQLRSALALPSGQTTLTSTGESASPRPKVTGSSHCDW